MPPNPSSSSNGADPNRQHRLDHSAYDTQYQRDQAPSQHQSGDIPPALSPLDAFALQGRMLAARFEEQDGKRLSRLPHLTIASELSRPRPTYSSAPRSPASPASNNRTPTSDTRDGSGASPEVGGAGNKHRSYYPSIQTFDDAESILSRDSVATTQTGLDMVAEDDQAEFDHRNQYDSGRSHSPDPIEEPVAVPQIYHDARVHQRSSSDLLAGPTDRSKNSRDVRAPQKSSTGDSYQSSSSVGLAPPRSPATRSRSPNGPQPSIRSVRMDSGDESDAYSFASDPYDLRAYDRKPSTSGAAHPRARSPFSPVFAPKRSPSISSDHSMGASNAPRRSVNFSRPMSPMGRIGRPSLETRPSFESWTRMANADLALPRPSLDALSLNDTTESTHHRRLPSASDGRYSTDDRKPSVELQDPNGAPSYTYAKYSLPRGRVVTRESVTVGDWMNNKFEWEQDFGKSNVVPVRDEEEPPIVQDVPPVTKDPPKPVSKVVPRTEPVARAPRFREEMDVQRPPDPLPQVQQVSQDKAKKHKRSRSSDAVISPVRKPQNPNLDLPTPISISSIAAEREAPRRSFDAVPTLRRTHKPKKSSTDITYPAPDQMSAEDHLKKGIESHEEGSLQKSTYHLRIAARAGNPTAMLLYALACRHGWGMRPNQGEGVLWLRKAVDMSKLEVADDELLFKPSKAVNGALNSDESQSGDVAAQRKHKAQLALAIYEIGMSYNNGWGIQQDKPLALRCFEIAGSWGDADALAEAGFCYAKGIGCKKDMQKAANLYRKAEAKGISMTGNSWIYKDKYMPVQEKDEDRHGRSADKEKEKDKDKKGRDKSRTRSIFRGRKKSNAAGD
ncbi:MAG: hypothetical protein M1828_001932 [Chrysothrix sp. TS-e1954]|nr:MAG: hypothetical protein M1828_001932 [Chrysothrix sp. TS-e1954]